jgi:hypothetical protein
MTKEQIKKLVKLVLPVLLAVGATLGYVDSNCTCSEPAPSAPVVVELDAGK